MTVWHPDTCGCTFQVDVDFVLVAVLAKCKAHAELDDAAAWESVYAHPASEQKLRNLVLIPALKADPALDLKEGAEVTCTWVGEGKDRHMEVVVKDAGGEDLAPEKLLALEAVLEVAAAGKAVVADPLVIVVEEKPGGGRGR